jgi:hypothetical protein
MKYIRHFEMRTEEKGVIVLQTRAVRRLVPRMTRRVFAENISAF